ncbi:Hypothetical protein, putative [Bodo saltans]|uniref:Uncharacterized protein n=1 Tax=Bodo saltans TaxID=75058 RepID=A0A0S4IJK1_BODSA|nr:Hypothetical protein, putative [Bodo saltans]|eukprot:CUE88431.1 Hypothetical protein, putative [Bodo saltans]
MIKLSTCVLFIFVKEKKIVEVPNMSDAPSEFVLVERHENDDGGSTSASGQSPAQLASDWTNVRLEERDPSPVIVNHNNSDAGDEGGEYAGYDDATLSPPPQEGPPSCDAPLDEEVKMLERLQKQLDEESVARFVHNENAKAAAENVDSNHRRCDCLGGSQGLHRLACPLRASSS